jgi:organic radical activating enzyme
MFNTVYLEISGICNARCPWCVTGNSKSKGEKHGFMGLDLFNATIQELISKQLISSQTVIGLHNWGEPSLHPELESIMDILVKAGIRFGISTNGSRYIPLSKRHLPYLDHMIYSMSGFSQKSYDKIHLLDIDKVFQNIEIVSELVNDKNFRGQVRMAFHLYQFNLNEIASAIDYCKRHGIRFAPVSALFNDFDMAVAYLTKQMDASVLDKAGRELMLYYVDELIKSRPANYYCPQWSILTIDEFANVLTCCGPSKSHADYSIGSLFDLSKEDIILKKQRQNVCKLCSKIGLDYWGHNPHLPELVENIMKAETVSSVVKNEQVVLEDIGQFIETIASMIEKHDTILALKLYKEKRPYYKEHPALLQMDQMMGKISNTGV